MGIICSKKTFLHKIQVKDGNSTRNVSKELQIFKED